MQKFDGIFTRLTLPIILLLTVYGISSCDDSAVVGSRVSPDDVTVSADTVLLDDLSVVSTPSFSGNANYFTAGEVDDPLFGNFKATALVRPSITRSAENDSLVDNAPMVMALNVDHIYGRDGLSAEYHVVEVGRRWRTSSWRYDSIPDLTSNIVGNFSVDEPDSITVTLDEGWTRKYRDILLNESAAERDSLFQEELPGLAIVPASSDEQMFSVEGSRAYFIFIEERVADENGEEEEEEEEEFQHHVKGLNSWAVSLDSDLHSDESFETGMVVKNTMRRMIEMDIPFTEDFLGTNNFSRVELVLYEEPQSSPPAGFLRPRSETMRIFHLEPDQLNYAVSGDPRFQSNQREEDGSFRFNLTNLANEQMHGSLTNQKLYAVIGFNDGRILPSLINGQGNSGRQPKLLITGISKEQ